MATPIDALCSNFLKFGQWEISEILCCLSDKKQNFAWLSSSCYCTDCAQNLPGLAPKLTMYSRVLQISSKLVHFWQSYSQMHEHRQNVL